MNTKSTYQIMMDMKTAAVAEQEKFKHEMHPDTLKKLFEMQGEKVPCINCNTITNTGVHVDMNGGMSIFTKYICPHCKHEFMEKDLHGVKE